MQIHQDQKREEKCRSLILTMLLYGHLGHVGYSKQAGKSRQAQYFVGWVYFSRCSLHELGRFLSNSGAFRLGVFCLYVGSDNAIYGSMHLNAFYT